MGSEADEGEDAEATRSATKAVSSCSLIGNSGLWTLKQSESRQMLLPEYFHGIKCSRLTLLPWQAKQW